MAYITQSDLTPARVTDEQLKQLTNETGSGEVDFGVVDQAITEACGLVDSYAARYSLPLTATAQVKSLAADIAIYKLFANPRVNRATEEMRTAFEDAVALLKDVAAGRASLDGQGTTQTSVMDVKVKDHGTKPDVFDENKIGSW